ncbi:MAG: hypothetical protein LBJ11_10185 [Oscillospiraceae bacterium]|nr:hypothetical protein [Oscillospiraceae bacterium]
MKNGIGRMGYIFLAVLLTLTGCFSVRIPAAEVPAPLTPPSSTVYNVQPFDGGELVQYYTLESDDSECYIAL